MRIKINFFDIYQVIFSKSQYFIYEKQFQKTNLDGILDKFTAWGNRKIAGGEENFLKGCIKGNPDVSLRWLQAALKEDFQCEISLSAIG